jgi:hypothetical protein
METASALLIEDNSADRGKIAYELRMDEDSSFELPTERFKLTGQPGPSTPGKRRNSTSSEAGKSFAG